MPARTTLRPIARRALAAQSDERLVRLLREGHEPAFDEIVRRYRGPLVGFAAAIVPTDGAEDVVQASLEKAHGALLADSREITLRPWLFAIVRNGALNEIRREPRVDELDEAMATATGPSEIAERHDDLDRLVVAMCALPAAQRQALVKRELEGLGHGEIAGQLGTTATAVRGLIFRARIRLRDAAGAVVPLPLLRALLTEAPASGLAAGGAGTGAAALIGGAAAKGGTMIAAAVVAVGTGIAIDRGRQDEPSRGGNVRAVEREADSKAVSDLGGTIAAAVTPPLRGAGPTRASSGKSEDVRSGGNESTGGSTEVRENDSESGDGIEAGDGETDVDLGGEGSDDDLESADSEGAGDDRSGPGGGGSGDDGGESPDPIPPDDDRDEGDSSSGSGDPAPSPEPLGPQPEPLGPQREGDGGGGSDQ